MEAIAVELNFRFDVAELAKHPVEIRLDRMIEHYWRVFQTPMFRAGLSIWVALTGDAAPAARVEASLKDLREHISVVWHDLSSDVPVSSRGLASVLHILIAALRCSALSSMRATCSASILDEPRGIRAS